MESNQSKFAPWAPVFGMRDEPLIGPFLAVELVSNVGKPSADMVCVVSTYKNVNRQDLANAALIVNAPALLQRANELLHLHMCEQEGMTSGQPSFNDWNRAVINLMGVVTACETPLELHEITTV